MMKRTVSVIAGLTLASGIGFAQQPPETQEYDPDRDITTETERDRGTGMEEPRSDSPVQSEYGTESEQDYDRDPTMTTETDRSTGQGQPGTDLTGKSAEELSGKSVVTADGEEVGEIDEIGYSSTHQERVATVEVGGFLGVGERRIAIPLSELKSSHEDENAVQTKMSREEIEAAEEFDDTGFTPGQDY